MSTMDKAREIVLNEISNGDYTKIGQVTYRINEKLVHIKGNSRRSNKYPFNINPAVLRADFEVYICGDENTFYVIPVHIIRMMYCDPDAMPDNYHSGYTIIDVHTDTNKIVFGTGGKGIDVTQYRSKTIIEIDRFNFDYEKYSSGEGDDHKNLKLWIADNPQFLNIENVINTEIDNHTFLSGDRPDIIFQMDNGLYAVVEIETTNLLPGAYQAIKYHSLLCAELGLKIESDKVKSYLVGWYIPDNVKEFCNKYSILCFEKRV